jgi:hypothetical protein
VLKNPKLQTRIHELGAEPMPMSPCEFGKLVQSQTVKWAKVIKSAGLKIDPVSRRGPYWLCRIPAFSTSAPQRTISAVDELLELLRRRRNLRDGAFVQQSFCTSGSLITARISAASLSTMSFGTPAVVEIECHDAVL